MELFVLIAVNAVTADVMGSIPPYSRPPHFGHALLLFTSLTFCLLNSDSLQPFPTNSQKGSGKEKQEIKGMPKGLFSNESKRDLR